MEQRRESRFKPNQLATLTVLGLRPGPILQACILDLSGSGMRLRTELPVPCGVPVEVAVPETVAKGKICRCEPVAAGFEVAIQGLETSPLR